MDDSNDHLEELQSLFILDKLLIVKLLSGDGFVRVQTRVQLMKALWHGAVPLESAGGCLAAPDRKTQGFSGSK